jgi:predicted site-specific integrase-resolvase
MSAARRLCDGALHRTTDHCGAAHCARYCFFPYRGQNADYMTTTTRAAIYARVSTSDQTCENQLLELRRYCEARGWQATEYVDTGISGAKDRRPALDALLKDAKRRRFDVLVCWRLDRLGRNLRHLVTMLET